MKGNKFSVIKDFINSDSYLNLTRTQLTILLCSYLCVSISGFYKYIKNNEVQTTKKIEDTLIEDKILKMYARGMSQRDIAKTIEEIYGFDASKDMISRITDKILPEIHQ